MYTLSLHGMYVAQTHKLVISLDAPCSVSMLPPLSDSEPPVLAEWLAAHGAELVECVVPDFNGIARGKILTVEKFLASVSEGSLYMPESALLVTVSGEYAKAPIELGDATIDHDVSLVPDPQTARMVPWSQQKVAQIIHHAECRDGRPTELAPREFLRRVLNAYKERGWQPIVAPELEFFLVEQSSQPAEPLRPRAGKLGRREIGRQTYGIDAIRDFDSVIAEITEYCSLLGIGIDTFSHESGTAQLEINFRHGDPLALCDQAFRFKRVARQAALQCGMYATFMARPMSDEPGSSMHIHQSVCDRKTGRNLFVDENGADSSLFLRHVGGLQRYLPQVMPLLVPNVNSYRRLALRADTPVNTAWGRDNRSCCLRVPLSNTQNRRIENRIPGADANPYLAVAASLVCGYLGMVEQLEPSEPNHDSAYQQPVSLPTTPEEGLQRFASSAPLREFLGERFVRALLAVRKSELAAYQSVVSSWERENLLLSL